MMTIPEEIQVKIKEAKEKKLTELDLSVNKKNKGIREIEYRVLTEIPLEVLELTQLQVLNLSGNKLTMLPELIVNLTNLTSLNLYNNQLTSLPESLGNLSNLTNLYLWSNQLTSLPESIGNLTNLTDFYLTGNILTELPESIGNFTNLTSLDLSNNQLTSLPESISNLTNLTSLDLRNNQLTSLPESIGNLTNLTDFYLTSNNITELPKSIGNLTNLTSLDLRNNPLTELPESINNLTNLTYLYLTSNNLTELPKSVVNLTNFTRLNLSINVNQLTDFPKWIVNPTKLFSLDLSNNQLTELPEFITVPESITKLSNLTELDLSSNQLSTIPESITNLSNLIRLDLSNNQLSTIPESIGKLSNLIKLDLSSNRRLSTIPESIGNLSNLIRLDLSNNQLSTIPESIGNLSNLTNLDLGYNQLSTLPESIGNLSNLTNLYLSYNQLSTIPESIGNLSNLTNLYLSSNQLSTIPESIGNLSNLTNLDLGYNQLSTLPESISKLSNLTNLYLSGNQLSTIPESIGHLSNLTNLDLGGNPLETPPLETCNKGIDAIREYFRKVLEEGYDTIYEAKFIIVGEGEAGKTSLMNKIVDPNYLVPQPEKATHGIDIRIFNFPVAEDKQFRVNIWDFGGQEIYHQTHQFFLTKRSLYALVTDSRKDHIHLDYWLQIVELLSESSPMLIIKNEKDCCVDIKDEGQIRTRFKEMVKEILDTNLATNTGLERIVNRMQEYIAELPLVGIKIPKSWAKVRKAIEDDKRDYISLDDYLKICDDCGYTTTSLPTFKRRNKARLTDGRLILSQFLHDLGIILHFQDDEESPLYDTVILNPTWGTQAVYELLKPKNNPVKENLGKFTYQDLKSIWSDARYDGKYRELLELMKRFKLCYKLPNVKPNIYIAPQLLDTNAPEYDWNNEDNLRLNYHYDFMPKGILSRFIVEMHDKIEEPKVWRYGVILTYQNTRAEVIETYNSREIKIKLEGYNKRGLLELITDKFDLINKSYKGLKVDIMIPCNCQTCQTKLEPHFFILQKLRERLNNNKMTIECQNPPYDDVNIHNLIDGTMGREQFDRSNQGNNNVTVNVNTQQHSGSGDNVGRDSNTFNNI